MVKLDYGRGNVLRTPLTFDLSRASTDNDRGLANFIPIMGLFSENKKWAKRERKIRARRIIKRDIGKNKTKVTLKIRVPGIKRFTLSYTLFRGGELQVSSSLQPRREMIRFGMTASLTQKTEKIEWYGRGEHENYCDRKSGAPIGRYSTSVKDFGHSYLRPQENGNHCDIRWIKFTDSRGEGINIEGVGKRLFEASCRPNPGKNWRKAPIFTISPAMTMSILILTGVSRVWEVMFPGSFGLWINTNCCPVKHMPTPLSLRKQG
jgi:beta-galactosidase